MDNYREKSLPGDALAKIKSLQSANESYEDFFKNAQNEWVDKIKELSAPIAKDLSPSTLKNIDLSQSKSLSYRGDITKEIATYQNKLNKEIVSLKEDEHDTVIFLVSGKCNFKISGTRQINVFLESVTAERKRSCEIIKTYIVFLRDIGQNLKDYQYTVKNIIELMKILNT